MTHKQKVRAARRSLRLRAQHATGKGGLFQSPAWAQRVDAKQARVRKEQDAAHERALARRKEKQPGILTRARRMAIAAIERRTAARRARREKYQRKNTTV